jgi:FlaA1/EpsC-like NDP-sugar epimerase
MTIPEAVQLVLQGAALSKGGEVFMLDMGEPVKIVDLARDLIHLSGLEEGRDLDIVFTGLRPGEKLFEEMFAAGEQYERTEHQKIYIAANASTFVPQGLDESISALEQAARFDDHAAIVRSLQQLIPEYCPPVFDTAAEEAQGKNPVTPSSDPREWRAYSPQTSTPAA